MLLNQWEKLCIGMEWLVIYKWQCSTNIGKICNTYTCPLHSLALSLPISPHSGCSTYQLLTLVINKWICVDGISSQFKLFPTCVNWLLYLPDGMELLTISVRRFLSSSGCHRERGEGSLVYLTLAQLMENVSHCAFLKWKRLGKKIYTFGNSTFP